MGAAGRAFDPGGTLNFAHQAGSSVGKGSAKIARRFAVSWGAPVTLVSMYPYDPVARDHALVRLRRARLAIAAVAVAVTGLASAAAAAGFRGHHRAPRDSAPPPAATPTPRPAPSGPDAVPLPPDGGPDPLQPPPQPPSATATSAPAPPADATSGGS